MFGKKLGSVVKLRIVLSIKFSAPKSASPPSSKTLKYE